MASTWVSPAVRTRCVGYHHARPQAKAHRSFTISGIGPCSQTPSFPLRFSIALFPHLLTYSFFRLFDLSTAVACSSPSNLILIDPRSSLAMPHPIHRCHLHTCLTSSLSPNSLSPDFDFRGAKPWNTVNT